MVAACCFISLAAMLFDFVFLHDHIGNVSNSQVGVAIQHWVRGTGGRAAQRRTEIPPEFTRRLHEGPDSQGRGTGSIASCSSQHRVCIFGHPKKYVVEHRSFYFLIRVMHVNINKDKNNGRSNVNFTGSLPDPGAAGGSLPKAEPGETSRSELRKSRTKHQ